MNLKILGSSSTGNCYILQSSTGEALVLEAGVSFNQVKQAVDFNINSIRGVLVTHSHGDHSQHAGNFVKYGIDVYCLKETADAIKEDHLQLHRFKVIEPQKRFHVGSFLVMAFSVQHDVPCVGYLISHNESGTILFLTDSAYSKYKFQNLNNIIVEANYDSNILQDRAERGTIIHKVHDRVLESHMSIQTCLALLQANDLSKVNNIVLCHLSDGNSNEKDFKRQVQQLTGKTVYIADKGMNINFNATPF